MFFAVFTVFVEFDFFRCVDFIPHGDVIGCFTNRTHHSDKKPLFFLCHSGGIISYYSWYAKRERMNKEQLKPLLGERPRWLRSPVCRLSEWHWAQYFLEYVAFDDHIIPKKRTVYTVHDCTYSAWTVTKDRPHGLPTKLMIDPFPGLILNTEDRIIRPLLAQPEFVTDFRVPLQLTFKRMFDVTSEQPDWYIEGMTRAFQESISFQIDAEEFRSVVKTFEKDFYPKR